MKQWISAFLAALLLLGVLASAETDWGDDAGFGEFSDGYDGSWVQVGALDFEFCLPEGWRETTAADGAAFAATTADGDAALGIRLAAEGVDDLAAWGAANLKSFRSDTANFYPVLLSGDRDALSVYLIISGSQVVAFDFNRTNADALSAEFALQIVGSACELWDDDDVPLLEGDGGFDFGEAFEAELG